MDGLTLEPGSRRRRPCAGNRPGFPAPLRATQCRARRGGTIPESILRRMPGVTTTIRSCGFWRSRFGDRFDRIRRQRGLKNQNVGGKFRYCRLRLGQRLGLADHANVVFEREHFAQSGAEDSLGIGQDHADELAVAAVSRLLRDFLPRSPEWLPSVPCTYARSKWYSSITTPTPRRPRSSKLRTTRPRQSICTFRRGTHNFGRQQNREVHHRAHRDVAVHREEHAVGGDVLRLRRIRAALRLHSTRQMQRKARSTLHVGIVLDRSLLLSAGPSCAVPFVWPRFLTSLPSVQRRLALPDFCQLMGSVHPGIRQAKLPKSWNKWG